MEHHLRAACEQSRAVLGLFNHHYQVGVCGGWGWAVVAMVMVLMLFMVMMVMMVVVMTTTNDDIDANCPTLGTGRAGCEPGAGA